MIAIPLRSILLMVLCSAGAVACRAQGQWLQMENNLEHDVNRYRWGSNVQVNLQSTSWRLDLTNRFLSDAFLLLGNRTNFRDEDLLTWQASRPLREKMGAHFYGRTAWFGQSRVFSQELYGGLRLRPGTSAWVEPVAGLVLDQRPGVAAAGERAPLRTDQGPLYGVRMAMTSVPEKGFPFQLSGEGLWQAMTPRLGHTLRLLGTSEQLFETTRLASRLQISSLRRDTYQAVSFLNRDTPPDQIPETIEATTSDTLAVGLNLDMPFWRGVRLVSRTDLTANNRFIRTEKQPQEVLFFETDFNRRALDTESGLVYNTSSLSARMALQVGVTTERRSLANREDLPPIEAIQKTNLLQQADYDETMIAFMANLRADLTPFLAMTGNGSTRIVRHDTPESNPDDRDERYHQGEVGMLVRLSSYLQADVKLLGSFYHTVYLNAERSAENNIQRTLRLRPSLHWTPRPATSVRFTSEVRATYTVDDFLLPGRRPLDQSAREMRYETEITHNLGSQVRLLANGSVGDLHLGRLFWDDFAEIPFDTLRTYNGWIRLQAGHRPMADVGLRVFIRSDYDRATTVFYTRVDEQGNPLLDEQGLPIRTSITRPGRKWIEQVGPTAAISWPMTRASMLRLDGWVNLQRIHHRLYGLLPEASASQIRKAARRGTHTLIPNISMTVVWNL